MAPTVTPIVRAIGDRAKANDQRDAAAVDQAAQHVAADLIVPQPELRRWRSAPQTGVDLCRIVRRHHRGEDRQQDQT